MYELDLCFYPLCTSIDYVIPAYLPSSIIDLISHLVSWSIANNMANCMLLHMPAKISVDDTFGNAELHKVRPHNCSDHYRKTMASCCRVRFGC